MKRMSLRLVFRAASAVALLLLTARGSRADVKVDVKQDPTTRLWRYAYTIQNDSAIQSKGVGEIEEVELGTRDLIGADVPLMALLPKGWSVAWDKDDDDHPLVVWDSLGDESDLKVDGLTSTFVLFSARSPGDATLTLVDGGGHEVPVTVQGPTGD